MSKIHADCTALKEQLGKIIFGKDDVIHKLLVALLAGGHVLIDDVPGVGKTVLSKSLARLLGGTFQRIQFTPDLMPRDVVGTHIFNPDTRRFELHRGPVHAHIVLADEINRATPRTQSALLEAMSEEQVTVEGETIPLPQPFMVLATQNPVEQQGTFPLPEAQLDRFMFKITVGYPGFDAELDMLACHGRGRILKDLTAVVSPEAIVESQQVVEDVEVTRDVQTYLLELVRATREHEDIQVGASPRASLALLRASRAEAYLAGRSYVAPDDIRAVFLDLIAHRLILAPEARLRGISPIQVAGDVLDVVAVPLETK